MMLPCCIGCPFHAIQAVHLENRIVLVGTIQAQIFGHHGRGDSAILRGEIIDYRFAAEITFNWNAEICENPATSSPPGIFSGRTRLGPMLGRSDGVSLPASEFGFWL